jgi:hypothetical protein
MSRAKPAFLSLFQIALSWMQIFVFHAIIRLMIDNEQFLCPYCGEYNALEIDPSGGSNQQFVVDCEVCCAPILIRLKMKAGEIVTLDARKENE